MTANGRRLSRPGPHATRDRSGANVQKHLCIGTSVAVVVEAMGLEPTNLLTASQALYQLSYAPSGGDPT